MQQSELARHRWRVLILGSVGMFMGTLLSTIVAVALPTLGPALHLSYSEALWVQSAYPLAMSVCLIPVGRLADRYGLMRFYVIGIAIFGVFSVACALASSGPSLIVARCLQGCGGAFTSATSSALVAAVFPPDKRGQGLGLNVMAGYIGLMAGPPLGGLIVSHISWHWIFLLNVPLALITLAGCWSLMGAEQRERAATKQAEARTGAPLDWPGTLLLAALLTSLFVPLISVPLWGWTSPLTLGLLACFVVLLVGFVIVENRMREPLLDLDLIRKNRLFAAGTFAAFLNYAAAQAIATLTAVFLQVSQGYSAQRTGLFMLTQPIFMVGLSPVFGRLSDRLGSRALASTGMVLVAAGMVQLGFLPSPTPVWRVILALGVVGLGMAAFSSPNTSAVMGAVDQSHLSLASGFLGTMRTAGQGVSLALLGAIAASGLGPTGGRVLFLGEQASEAAAASFAAGYGIAMWVGAGLALAGALVSLVRGPQEE